MFCTNCGKEIKDGSIFCAYCGTKVEKDAKDATKQFEEKKVALKPEIVVSSVEKDWTNTKTDIEKIKQIIGKNTNYYLRQFESIHQTGKGKFNWAAFFLGVFHVGYRNNWKGWWKAMRLPVLCALGSGTLGGIISFFHWTIGMILLFVMEVFLLWMGIAQILYAFHFNKIYMQHVEQKVSENELKTDPSIGRGILFFFGFSAIGTIVVRIYIVGMLFSVFSGNAIDDWNTNIEDYNIEDYMEDFEYDESYDLTEYLPEDIRNDADFDDSTSDEMNNSLWGNNTNQSTYNPESNGAMEEDMSTLDLNTYIPTLYSPYDGDEIISLGIDDTGKLNVYRGKPNIEETYYTQTYDTYAINGNTLYGYVGNLADEFHFYEDGMVDVLLTLDGSTHYQAYIQEEVYFNTDWRKEFGYE